MGLETRSAQQRAAPRLLGGSLAVWRGRPSPLGASWDGAGVNFALYSQHASRVELCLFDPKGRREIGRVELTERTDHVWHGYLPAARPGLLYGYRVHGSYAPARGHRFNPNKLLLDPYAKRIAGELAWSDAQFGYRLGSRREDMAMDTRDSAGGMPKSMVIDDAFTWGHDKPPRVPWSDTVIYEAHVKGLTMRHPGVPEQLRGTYAGLACPAVVEHLKALGVTSLELMPVHTFVDDRHLVERGLRNYWGYNSIGFFAPDSRYSASGEIGEFKSMVRTLHDAGIEVILDVVFNHTAEGNHQGPMFSFKGIDNASYYRLMQGDERHYMDTTGCGNTLDSGSTAALRLIMDSLRYWITEMHVDGFRFDLASALGREPHGFDTRSSFFAVIRQDPVISGVKLIAEPWDVGDGGYQVGGFPTGWTEWNGKYRDVIRAYWKGEGGVIGELAYRLSGSSDLYAAGGRGPSASVNFVTAHDGFTLHDLVSYNDKHNEANGEDNRDGDSNNHSWNCGAEGPTDDPAVLQLREQQKRNLLATLFFSQGVPMLCAGDEMGRTQHGNNNAYCQDNEVSWLDWELDGPGEALLAFTQRLAALRSAHPLFRRRTFFRGIELEEDGAKDMQWLRPDGLEMTHAQWAESHARCLGVRLSGRGLAESDEKGRPINDDDLVLLFNAHHERIDFQLPPCDPPGWEVLIDTFEADGLPSDAAPRNGGGSYPLQGRTMVLLRHQERAQALNA